MAAFLCLALLLGGCSETDSSADPSTSAKASTSSSSTADSKVQKALLEDGASSPKGGIEKVGKNGKPEPASAPRAAHERPMPNFEGRTLSGTSLRIGDLLGTRVVVFLFNPEVKTTLPVAEAVARVSAFRADHNFKIVGVGIGSSPSKLTQFVAEQKLDFPVLDDSSGAITSVLRLRSPVALIGMDPEGYINFGIGAFASEGDVAASVEADLRARLRLGEAKTATSGDPGALFAYPDAPALGVKGMTSGEVVEVKDLAGKPAVVIFFLHTCPHCHNALKSLKTSLEAIEESKRPRLVAVSIQGNTSAIRSAMKEQGLTYFDPYLDPGQVATDRWGVTGGVPAIFVLDEKGRIRHRSSGWDDKRDAGVLRMKLAQLAGAQVPMLLDPKGYSGSEVCGICHEQELATWEFTQHSRAYDTLVTHTADRRTDCVGCHVVGFEETGGYNFETLPRPEHLENVGCESCHGRGGPHLSPAFVPDGNYETVCATCHNPTHSLGFDYATFHPRVGHAAIAAMSNTERAGLLEGGPQRDLLPTKGNFVGSDACQSCHESEFKTWSDSPHGHAVATLEKEGKAADTECLVCHTTGFGKPGGFPESALVANEPDLARVGCESCHGPGSEHIGENAKRTGTIISLGDKCDSCVILKICGSCHDDANDPGFQFKVEERIDAQRHGTIESAASQAGGEQAHLAPHSPHAPHLAHSSGTSDTSHPSEKAAPVSAAPDRSRDAAMLNEAFDRLGAASRVSRSPATTANPS